MGAEESVPIPPPPPSAYPDQRYSPYFMFSLYYDTLHLVYAPPEIANLIVKTATLALGANSIQYHKPKLEHGYKIVFHETLFRIGTSAETALRSRYLMAVMLQKLGIAGWIPVVTSDLRRMGDCANVLMQYSPEQRFAEGISSNILVVGISGWDKVRVFTRHQPIISGVEEAIKQNLPIQDVEREEINGVALVKFKISGTPWGYVSEPESIAARATIARIIENMQNINLRLLINFNTKPSADTYFFIAGAQNVDPSHHGHITLGLNSNDQLRVIANRKDAAFDNVVNSLRIVIQKHWHRGLQNEWSAHRSHTFKFKGNPWWTDGSETVESRIIVAKIFEVMLALGWRVNCATDISRKPQDKTTFIFENVGHSVNVVVPCLSFNERDKIRAINMPGDVLGALGQTIDRLWNVTRTQQYGRSTEWKLGGGIWDFSNYYGKALAMHMLSTMNRFHYALYVSADVSSKFVHRKNAPDYPIDVHSWFFIPVSALRQPAPPPAPVAPVAPPDEPMSFLAAASPRPFDPTAPYLPSSRNPSPFQSAAASPERSPCPSPASTASGRGTPAPRGASAPYYHPGHSDFEPLPGGPVPEINLEMSDGPSAPPAFDEAPPPSYDDVVQNWPSPPAYPQK